MSSIREALNCAMPLGSSYPGDDLYLSYNS